MQFNIKSLAEILNVLHIRIDLDRADLGEAEQIHAKRFYI